MQKMKIKSVTHVIGFALTLAVSQQTLLAQTERSFTTTPASDYATAGNWTSSVVPTGTDNANIGNYVTASAVYNSATSFTTTGRNLIGIGGGIGSLTMGSGSGTLTYGGDGSGSANFIGVDGGTGSLTMNGGTYRVIGSAGDTGYLRIGANASTGTATINAGQLVIGHSASLGAAYDNAATAATGTGTLTIAGSGQVTVGSLNNVTTIGGNSGYLYLKNNVVGSSGSATVNLNGGSLTAKRIVAGTGGGTKTVNFNGGTLIAGASDANFLDAASGFTANVQNGGALINTQAFNVTVGAALVANGSGGLTKTGSGTLTLSGNNTFTGGTTVSAGTLATGATGNFGTGNVTVSSGAFLTLGNNTSIADGASLFFNKNSTAASISFTSGESLFTLSDTVSGTFISAGTYTAGQLNTFFGGSGVFTGGSVIVASSAIPEPSTYAALAGLFVIGFAAVRRRR